mgnify:CR=1 FL=1
MKLELINKFAPAGKLRASINLGNPILANKRPDTGEPFGVSVDLANEFAKRLGVHIELVVFDAAGKSVDAVKAEKADIGFFAIDPVRGQGIAFTPPYVLIEGSYLVRTDSPLTDNAQVDQSSHRVVVGQGSAYDLFLTRELKAAQIVRAPSSPAVFEVYLTQQLEVAAGVKQQLQAWEDAGYGRYPICVAKTQSSFSTDPTLRGAPSGHIVNIREVRLAAGAQFIVMICGDIMTMPGLPKVPSAVKIDIDESGKVVGLF